MSKNMPWRAEDDAYLREHYPTQPTAAVAAHLQRCLSWGPTAPGVLTEGECLPCGH